MLAQKMKTTAHIESCNHSSQRGPSPSPPLPPILWISPFIDYPFASNPTTAHSVVLFLWLNGWSRDIWCASFLNDVMDVQMSSFRTLMHVLCHKVSSLLRPDTWCGFLLVLWFDNTHTTKHKHTQHTQWPVDQHIHVNIYLHQLLCAHSSYHYYTEWITHWCQKFTFHNVFSFQGLFICKSHICWLDAIRLGSFCETRIIMIETV